MGLVAQAARGNHSTEGGTTDGQKQTPDEFSFEPMSKRRGIPLRDRRQARDRSVKGGEKELLERLGNTTLPCGSGRRFQELLS